MISENRTRLYAALALVFITVTPFVVKLYPETIVYFLYPILSLAIALYPALFALQFAPQLGQKIVQIYESYHKKRNHKFVIYEGKSKHVIPLLHVSLLASLIPLGIVFKFVDGSALVNEIDMTLVATVFTAQFITCIFCYSLYVLSRSKLMIEFAGGSRYNIGDRIREKLNIVGYSSILIMIYIMYQAIISDQLLILGTLALSAVVCFGSNLCGFYFLKRIKRITLSVRHLNKLLRTSFF